MSCVGGKSAFLNACPETWKLLGLVGLFIGMLVIYFVFISQNKAAVAKGVFSLLRVKHPRKMALVSRYLVPVIYWAIFVAITFYVIRTTGSVENKYVQGSGLGLGLIGVVLLVIIRETVLEAAKYGPQVLMEQAFDDNDDVRVEDMHYKKEWWGRVIEVEALDTIFVDEDNMEFKIPNRKLVKCIKTNYSRRHFYWVRLPLVEAPEGLDKAIQARQKEIGLYVATTKAEKVYNKTFKTASADGVSNTNCPVRVLWKREGPEILLPVENRRAESYVWENVHRLIQQGILKPRL